MRDSLELSPDVKFITCSFLDYSGISAHNEEIPFGYVSSTLNGHVFDNYVVKTRIQFTQVSKFLEHDKMWRLQFFVVI